MSSIYLKQNLGLLRLYSLGYLDLWKLMTMLATTRGKEEPMATPWEPMATDYKTYCLEINESVM